MVTAPFRYQMGILACLCALAGSDSAAAKGKELGSKKVGPTEILAKAVNSTLKLEIDPHAMDGGLPEVLTQLVRHVMPDYAATYFKKANKLAGEFEEAWLAYESSKERAAEALKKAEELRAAGETVAAKDTLRASITEVSATIDRIKAPVHPIDAEVPAIGALAEILGAEKDYRGLIGLVPALNQRLRVQAKPDELLDFVLGRTHSQLRVRKSEWRPLKLALDQARKSIDRTLDGGKMALGFYKSLERYGLHEIGIADLRKKAKRGTWIHFPLPVQYIDGQEGKLVLNSKEKVAYGCKNDYPIGYDPFYGKLVWKRKCKWRTVKTDINVTVAFTEPPPDWLPKRGRIVVVGKVTKAGRKTVLADAFIADLRSIRRPSSLMGGITEPE